MNIFNRFKSAAKRFKKEKKGDAAVEMAVLFPIVLIVVAFVVDQFIYYDGATAMVTVVNEASRYAAVEESKSDAENVVVALLSGKDGRLSASKLGDCNNANDAANCDFVAEDMIEIEIGTLNKNGFNKDEEYKDKTGNPWCNGNYFSLTVTAHKTSLLPSYQNFRNLIMKDPENPYNKWYHEYKYTIINRIETSNPCVLPRNNP